MSPRDPEYLLHQIAVELRYNDGLLYYDKSGEVQRGLLRSLGQPFVASHPAARVTELGATITSSTVKSPAEHIDIQFDAERFWARHFGADNLARMEQIVPVAWDIVSGKLGVKGDVRRSGVRYWVMWPAESAEAAQAMLERLSVFEATSRWKDIFGSPKKRTFIGIVEDGRREIRYSLSTGAAKVEEGAPDSLKKFNVPHGLLLDVDHSETSEVVGEVGKQDLKDFIRDSWTKTKNVAEHLEKALI